jgi:FkbM family methyltransferase
MSRLLHVLELLRTPPPEAEVSWTWLFRRPSILDRKFRKTAAIRIRKGDSFQEVIINGELFLWPPGAVIDSLLQIVSELQTPNHPNQYLWGPTTVSAGDTVLDIGACEGSFAARTACLGAKVIAVEPSKTMSEIMRRMFEIRGLPEPQIANHLLGSEACTLHFIENEANPGKSRVVPKPTADSYPVEVLTLDQLVDSLGLKKLDFIKCDAEGADVDIIKSGAETLQRFRPKLALCTYHRDNDYYELHHFLREFGYRIRGKGFLHAPTKFRVVMLHAWQ